MRALRPCVSLVLLVLIAGCAEEGARRAGGDCADTVRAALAARGIDPATVVSMTYDAQRQSEAKTVVDRMIWVRTDSCRGYYVARIDSGCRVIELFPTGDCALPPRQG